MRQDRNKIEIVWWNCWWSSRFWHRYFHCWVIWDSKFSILCREKKIMNRTWNFSFHFFIMLCFWVLLLNSVKLFLCDVFYARWTFDFLFHFTVCDPKSLLYLYGMQLDYSDALIGGGFSFSNPNATSTCGCGKSFAA